MPVVVPLYVALVAVVPLTFALHTYVPPVAGSLTTGAVTVDDVPEHTAGGGVNVIVGVGYTEIVALDVPLHVFTSSTDTVTV